MLILLYGLCEVRNTVIDGESVSSLAHGFLRLGRIGSYVCIWWVGGWNTKALSICSSALGSGLPLPCVGSPLLSVWHWESQHRTDAAYRHVGSSRQGIAPTRNIHNHTEKQGKAESSLGRTIRGEKKKKLGSQGGQLSADSASPPLCDSLGSLLNQGLAVCLFGW